MLQIVVVIFAGALSSDLGKCNAILKDWLQYYIEFKHKIPSKKEYLPNKQFKRDLQILFSQKRGNSYMAFSPLSEIQSLKSGFVQRICEKIIKECCIDIPERRKKITSPFLLVLYILYNIIEYLVVHQ